MGTKKGIKSLEEAIEPLSNHKMVRMIQNPKTKGGVTESDIKALRAYLELKEYLEKEVFPKIKIEFSYNYQH